MNTERGFVRKSGAGDAGVIFFLVKSLGVDGLKRMIPRDLMDVYNGLGMMYREIFVYGLFMDNSSTQSLKHMALRFCRRQEWNADS